MPKNWRFWTVVLEKTLESPLGFKEIQPVHPKGDQSWVFIGRTDAEAETPILWSTDSLEKILMLGKIEGSRRRGQQRRRWLDGVTDSMDISLIKQALGAGDGQGVGVLQSMGLQRVRHDWATKLNYSASDYLVKTECGSQWKCFESRGGQNLERIGKMTEHRDQNIFYYSWQLKTLRILNHQFKFWGLEANPTLLVSHSDILDL